MYSIFKGEPECIILIISSSIRDFEKTNIRIITSNESKIRKVREKLSSKIMVTLQKALSKYKSGKMVSLVS